VNKETILESGLLELYVLGKTTDAESIEIQQLLSKYPELIAELDLIAECLQTYAQEMHQTDLDSTKENIIQKLHLNTTMKPLFNMNRFAIAASLVLISMLTLYSLSLYNENQKLNEEIAELNQKNSQLAYQNLINKANYRNMSEQLALLHKHGTKTTQLEGNQRMPTASAMIYWNSETKELYINIDKLEKLPQGKQYQLWALKGGKPINAGLISTNLQINQIYKMQNIDDAEAFAISIEKEGGELQPTKEQIIAFGKI
jgi:hypothetical protein